MAGRLLGIARHSRPRGAIETLDRVAVTVARGVEGNARGVIAPGKSGKRQVSILSAEDWAAAMAEFGLVGEAALAWHVRRANLLVSGLELPRRAGAVIAIGPSLRIETTVECDPCERMDEIRPGLRAALTPHWRGGVLGRVLADGDIAVGDEVRMEQ